MTISRRRLLQTTAAIGVTTALSVLVSRHVRWPRGTLTQLVRDPDKLLDLAPGFSYVVVDRALDGMSDGNRVPGSPDGMGCFEGPDGTLVLMRNHELDVDISRAAYLEAPTESYDAKSFGAVTRVVLDAKTLEPKQSNLVLAGTLRNCGGGKSPWGWLSAEEAVDAGHGYVFACPADASRLLPANRIAAYGRFNHESVSIHSVTHYAYLTEDQPDGCLYRFACPDPNEPFRGKLQALRVVGEPLFDTGRAAVGVKHSVDWVDITDPDPTSDSVRYQAQERGAALFRRAEGTIFHQGVVYVCATVGGHMGLGQILELKDGPNGTLKVLAESSDPHQLEMPDNITMSPRGEVYMAEDGLDSEQYIRAIMPSGSVVDVARNSAGDGELAGLCFSPDGSTLFANLYDPGVTLAIRGPFTELDRRLADSRFRLT